jgi:SAM-dependent methyltransferase
MSGPQEYMFKYSDEEVRRLVVQSTYWSDLTEDLLRKAGLSAGMHVLDVGSGVGDVAMIAARLVGEGGSVRGIDGSPDSLAVARRRAASAGLTNIVFEQAEIDSYETADRFNAIIGRLILIHLPAPAATLRRLSGLLAPAGLVVFQEPDVSGVNMDPASELSTLVCGWFTQAFERAGIDLKFGQRLPRLMLEAGLPAAHSIAVQRLESPGTRRNMEFFEVSIRAILPLLERFGIATAEEVDVSTLSQRVIEDTVSHDGTWHSVRMVGAWTRTQGI